LEELQAEEMQLCWHAAVLQADIDEITEELARAKPLEDDLDPQEQKVVMFLENIMDRVGEYRAQGLLSNEQLDEHIKGRTLAINKRREAILTETKWETSPLSSLLGAGDEEENEEECDDGADDSDW
jgi:ribosome-binding protein aMBF1 (putative translation factor)